MRMYKLKHIPTNRYVTGMDWSRSLDWRAKASLGPIFSNESTFKEIYEVNEIISRALEYGHGQVLDEIEIQTFETQDPIPLKGGIKMGTVKNRIQANLIMAKLKNDPGTEEILKW